MTHPSVIDPLPQPALRKGNLYGVRFMYWVAKGSGLMEHLVLSESQLRLIVAENPKMAAETIRRDELQFNYRDIEISNVNFMHSVEFL